ncbi:MAG: alpha/beta fold hydrolase [Cyanobacteria bacterium SBLK]|nr:alpha/beta fold hydrolase [Cyanobacteria bacterium SBLK]
MISTTQWHERVGLQRDWVWRGWQVRYSFLRGPADKTPVLLLHGFGAAIEHWRKNIPVLGEERTVYALDLLGFGGSRKAIAPYGAELWVAQVYDFWRTFIGEPVVLVGNSLGSLVSFMTAATHPEMVKGLAMLSLPDLTLREKSVPKPFRSLVFAIESFFTAPIFLKPLFHFVRRPSMIRTWVTLAYGHKEAVDGELVDILALPPTDEGAFDAFCALSSSVRQSGMTRSVRELLPELTIPILLIWGRQDPMIPFSLSKNFLGLNPNLEFVPLDKAGHCPHDEDPEIFHKIILPWLVAKIDGSIEKNSLKVVNLHAEIH